MSHDDQCPWGNDDDSWWHQQDLELRQQAEAQDQLHMMALRMCLAEIQYQIELMEGRTK